MSGYVWPMLHAPNGPWSDVSIDQISTTVTTVLADYLKSSERLIYWDDNLKVNIDPFSTLEGGFFTADWDFKVRRP